MTITAITFDFWATIYKSKTVDYTERLLALQNMVQARSSAEFDSDQFKAAVRTARHNWSRVWMEEHRTIPADEWLGLMLEALDTSLAPADLAEVAQHMENSVLDDLPSLAPDIREILADLSRNHKLAVISDTGITPGRILRQLLIQDGIDRYFSHLTFSDEIGRSKPHASAFLTTLAALGAKPAQAVHVGDLLRTDIAGAQAVGMRAVQYTGISKDDWIAATDDPAQAVVPDAVISRHRELIPLLSRWNGTPLAHCS